MNPWLLRARLLGLFLLGALVGFAGLVTHAGWFPGGLLLALAGLGGLAYGALVLTGDRSGPWAAGAGWALTVLPFTFWVRPEGDFLVTDLSAALFLYGGVLLVVMCATVLRPPRSRFDGPGDRAGRPQ
ncbi:hypothetical protein GL263_04930 [Streptomyces durbertensis]|uniref:Integral membrane protein n=1 Tax=Streptomyces durbertensis TaxID=2448886 RepID=A0ABR6ECU6_9ACTN|nr:DUF6113 family protein [Streptomyces durbertensis]MBB1242912.1 hypothetical protein [Streptomyces durbertensis]